MANSIKASREALREKIAARKAAKDKVVNKWARLRQVAAEEAQDVDSALVEVAEAFGSMAEAMTNLKDNLDLIRAPKTADLKVRIASARKYAATFKRIAEESPEIVADAVTEVYHSLDDVAGAIESLAENMGIDLNLSPTEEAFAEEEEHTPEEPEVNEPEFEEAEEELKTPEGEEAEEESDKIEDEAEEEVEDEEIEKEAAAVDWTTDRDENGEPKTPEKLDIPQAQGDRPDNW